jgi:carbonic anhydrase/acetyltransferase-like protein (isoleucine patch superfamily)
MGDSKKGISPRLERPKIDPEAWVAPGAVLLGRITVRRGASIWYGCVLRSDFEGAEIVIGEDTNIQDGTLVHVDTNSPCLIGARVTVGHGAIVAAGALVPEGAAIPPGSLAAGIPAKVRRDVTGADRAMMEHGWRVYAGLKEVHRRETEKPPVDPSGTDEG